MAGIDILNLNLSIVYQFVLYLLTLIILGKFLIKPVAATLAERRRRLAPTKADTGLEAAISGKEAEYKNLLQEIRSVSGGLRQEVRAEAVSVERGIIAEAREKASEKLKAGEKEIRSSLENARVEMSLEIPKMARELAARILGREL